VCPYAGIDQFVLRTQKAFGTNKYVYMLPTKNLIQNILLELSNKVGRNLIKFHEKEARKDLENLFAFFKD
jgi:hypothetical protein